MAEQSERAYPRKNRPKAVLLRQAVGIVLLGAALILGAFSPAATFFRLGPMLPNSPARASTLAPLTMDVSSALGTNGGPGEP